MASTENPISQAETNELHVEVEQNSNASSNASPSPAVNGHKSEDVESQGLTIDVSEPSKVEKAPSDVTSQDGNDHSTSEGPKSPNDASGVGSENGSLPSSSSAKIASVSPTSSDSKIKKARTKFEQQGSFDKKGGKRKEKVKYAGLSTAKNRFMDAATADERQTHEKRKPKRITPPRDGNLTGVVENQPAERDPNIVLSDMFVADDVPAPATTKNALARFREMEKGGTDAEGRRQSAGKVEVDTAVTKNLMNVWKTRETNPEPEGSKERKSQIKIREEVEGGVYENQPTVLEDVVRAGDQPPEQLPEGIDTRALRDRFLSNANEGGQMKKHNALEEISELARREQHVVYENQPQAPTEGVVRGNYEDDRQEAMAINTKELKQRFLKANEKPVTPKQPINIREGEGGVYENAPSQRDDVVRASDYQALNPQEEVGQWAQEAKMRFMEDANRLADSINRDGKRPVQLDLAEGGVFENEPIRREDVVRAGQDAEDPVLAENTVKSSMQRLQEIKEQASKIQTSKAPVKLAAEGEAGAGVYENVPASSKADYTASDMMDAEAKVEGKYASEAKRLFLQRQAEEEEARKRKEAPQMIDIWSDLCKDSGVFENRPKERDPNVIREYSEDEEEEEGEEEGEEEEEKKAEEETKE